MHDSMLISTVLASTPSYTNLYPAAPPQAAEWASDILMMVACAMLTLQHFAATTIRIQKGSVKICIFWRVMCFTDDCYSDQGQNTQKRQHLQQIPISTHISTESHNALSPKTDCNGTRSRGRSAALQHHGVCVFVRARCGINWRPFSWKP